MRTTWIVGALIAGLVACTARGADGEHRPAAAGKGPVAAIVAAARGEARVVAAGQKFPAEAGFQLLKTDLLEVPAGGFLVVRLKNDYLVSLDEDLELEVKDIALLDAPASSRSVEAQLGDLVERGDIRSGDRIAGYVGRILAGVDHREEVAAKRKSAPRKKAVSEAMPAPPAPAPARAAAAPALGASLSKRKLEPLAPAARADRGPVAESAAPRMEKKRVAKSADADEEALAPAESAEPEAPTLAAYLLEARACAASELRPLVKAGTRPTVLVRVRDGRIARVRLGGALPVPGCLEAALKGKPLPLAEGVWHTAELTLE